MDAAAIVSRLVLAAGGLPEGLAQQLLRGALDEVCRTTSVWREPRSFAVPEWHEARPGAKIALPKVKSGVRRVGIVWLTLRGQRPPRALAPDVHAGVLVDRVGCVKAGDELAWEDVLSPEDGAGLAVVPGRVLSALAPAAVELAKARAFEMPRRPWTDAALAQAARVQYSRELSDVLRREITGNSRGPMVYETPEAFFDE